jgi:muconate cycloisomerase
VDGRDKHGHDVEGLSPRPEIPMKIVRLEPIAVGLPMLKPVIMAGEAVRRADNVLVRVRSDDGFVGWGEAASAPTMTGETVPGMVAAVRHLASALEGRDAADIAGALAAMHGSLYGNHGAKAAIEIALHDLLGRALRRPVHALIGERQRSRIALLGVIGSGELDDDLRQATAKKEQGFTAFKIKVGIDTPEADAERTRKICALLGRDCLISADANQGFTIAQALAYARGVEGSELGFFEQPVGASDLAGMAEIAAATDVPIGADEGIHSADDIRRHHDRGAARGVSLKAIKLGGLRALVEAGRLCEGLDMRVNVSCKTGESSIACAAALHAAAVLPRIDWALTLTHSGLVADVTGQPIRVEQGFAAVLDRPGLGIDVDEDCVRRHRV